MWLAGVEDERGAFSAVFVSALSNVSANKGSILDVEVAVLASVWLDDNAAVMCIGIVGVRLSEDFRNLQTNRTFLNTEQLAHRQLFVHIYH